MDGERHKKKKKKLNVTVAPLGAKGIMTKKNKRRMGKWEKEGLSSCLFRDFAFPKKAYTASYTSSWEKTSCLSIWHWYSHGDSSFGSFCCETEVILGDVIVRSIHKDAVQSSSNQPNDEFGRIPGPSVPLCQIEIAYQEEEPKALGSSSRS